MVGETRRRRAGQGGRFLSSSPKAHFLLPLREIPWRQFPAIKLLLDHRPHPAVRDVLGPVALDTRRVGTRRSHQSTPVHQLARQKTDCHADLHRASLQ
jgi:hypothetical protein